ncbi:hypothetical protein BDZ94DRAFT_1264624 [Collybia nuda]|uniref:Uncharacterized protein n=1 Tax=Collybia nuda TaxID=64659 RepID=A0A9P5Y2K2_9AGAR|nr:hypothetical protein BDZ94DRAFT_1264624 [Collybia nuda]
MFDTLVTSHHPSQQVFERRQARSLIFPFSNNGVSTVINFIFFSEANCIDPSTIH